MSSSDDGAATEGASLVEAPRTDAVVAAEPAAAASALAAARSSSNGSAAASPPQPPADAAPSEAGGAAPAADDGGLVPPLPRVPWGLNTTATLMVLWLLCFYVSAYTIVPFVLERAGLDPAAAAAGVPQALRHLLLDLSQLGFTLALLARMLGPYSPRGLGLFRAPLRPLKDWLPSVAGGALLFPMVDWLHRTMVALLAAAAAAPAPLVAPAAEGAAGAGVGVAAGDLASRCVWVVGLTVVAPVWEELLFRGFLLPSLARRLPPAAAVAATSLLFALVHFTQEGFVPLLVLGAVFGAAYARTRNLLAPVALHSLWNVWLLATLALGG